MFFTKPRSAEKPPVHADLPDATGAPRNNVQPLFQEEQPLEATTQHMPETDFSQEATLSEHGQPMADDLSTFTENPAERKSLSDLMVAEGALTALELSHLPPHVRDNPEALINTLGQSGKLSAWQQAKYKALAHDFDVLDDGEMALQTAVHLDGIDANFLNYFTCVPIQLNPTENTVTWAAADLPNQRLNSEIVLRIRDKQHQFVWASPKAIEDAIARSLNADESTMQALVEEVNAHLNSGNDDAVIQLVNEIIRRSYQRGASDIHISIINRQPLVQMRIDNELEELVSLPRGVYDRVLGRLRHLAGVSAENFKKPLFGRLTFELSNRQHVDIRYTTQPISLENTAKIAMRFLRPFEGTMDTLGYGHTNISKMDQLMKFEEGVIIFAGPTGSGKSTSARLLIRRGQRPGQNVISYEKQIEERLDNVVQTEEDVSAGLNLESFMYAALGLDPDVLFIGEVRSPADTLKTIDAGNLGHLVLTTMHANDAFMTLDRLLQRGVPAEQIFANVRGIIAQRLVRRVCPKCRVPVKVDEPMAEELNKVRNANFKAGQTIFNVNEAGCDHCNKRGFLGRVAMEEVLELWQRSIHKNIWNGQQLRPDWIDIVRSQAVKNGMHDMLHQGMTHVKNGTTTLSELERFFSADLETTRI